MAENKAREAIEKAFEEHGAVPEGEAVESGVSETEAEVVSEPPDVSEPSKAVSGDESKADVEKAASDVGSTPGDAARAEANKGAQSPSVAVEDAPPFWKPEHKALWGKITDPEVRKVIKENEAGRNRLTQHLKQVVNEKIGQWSGANFDEVFPAERMRALAIEGKTAAQATEALWAWNDYLEESPHAAIAEMMERYGLTAEDIWNHSQGQPSQQAQPAEDPRITELLNWREQQEGAVKNARIRAQLDAFGAENENGKMLRPYWNEVKKYIKGILPLVYSENPDITDYEALHKAYEMAAYANPQVRAKLSNGNGTNGNGTQVRFDAQKTQRAKEASSSLPSSSSNTAELPKTAKTARDALDMAWKEHTSR